MNIAAPLTHSCCEHDFEPDHLHPTVSRLFTPSGVDGVYGRTGAYECTVEALAALISRNWPKRGGSVPFSAGHAARLP